MVYALECPSYLLRILGENLRSANGGKRIAITNIHTQELLASVSLFGLISGAEKTGSCCCRQFSWIWGECVACRGAWSLIGGDGISPHLVAIGHGPSWQVEKIGRWLVAWSFRGTGLGPRRISFF